MPDRAPVTAKVPPTVALFVTPRLFNVAAPMTPRVPEQEAFARDVRPVTPRVPEQVAFVSVVRPVTSKEFQIFAVVATVSVKAPAAPRLPTLRDNVFGTLFRVLIDNGA